MIITTIAAHQVLALHRRRVLSTVTGTLFGVTLLAGVLGWASHQTIIGVYDESVKLLASRGLSAPPNPFPLKPPLSLLSNEVIYIMMIGALIAVILGHLTVAEDDTTGIGRLVFSRRMSRSQYAAGKVTAIACILATSLVACAVISIAALSIINRKLPAFNDVQHLGLFFVLSWLYLMTFALVGMVTLLMTGRRSLGLLSAMGVWLVVTFAIPQFTSGLRPSQSLNPVVDPISTSQTFFNFTRRARPFSVAEQFKEASTTILGISAKESSADTVVRVLPLLVLAVMLLILTMRLINGHDFSRGTSGE